MRPSVTILPSATRSERRNASILALHGRGVMARSFSGHWVRCRELGVTVALPQSSQLICHGICGWDDRQKAIDEIQSAYQFVSQHGHARGSIVLAGYAQGADVAIEMATTGGVVSATGLLAIAPEDLLASLSKAVSRRQVVPPLRAFIVAGRQRLDRRQIAVARRRLDALGIVHKFRFTNGRQEFPADFDTTLIEALQFLVWSLDE